MIRKFGVRYGATPRNKAFEIELVQKRPQKCPYCAKYKIKRIAAGIYNCQSCQKKFTGKAWSPK